MRLPVVVTKKDSIVSGPFVITKNRDNDDVYTLNMNLYIGNYSNQQQFPIAIREFSFTDKTRIRRNIRCDVSGNTTYAPDGIEYIFQNDHFRCSVIEFRQIPNVTNFVINYVSKASGNRSTITIVSSDISGDISMEQQNYTGSKLSSSRGCKFNPNTGWVTTYVK